MDDAEEFERAVAMLHHEDSTVREEAIGILRKLKDRHAVKPVIRALKDDDDDVRFAAISALAEMGDRRAVLPLTWTLLNDEGGTECGSLRLYAAMSLGQLGDKRAIPALVAALGDADTEVGHWAGKALVEIGVASVPPLIATLKSENRDAAWHAAATLGELADRRAVEPLIELLQEKVREKDVRARAAASLGMLGDSRAVEPLIEALEDAEWPVRHAAAYALGRLRDPRAVEPLIATLNLKDPEKDWSLGWDAVTGPAHLRWAAAEALGNIGNARALPALYWMLGHDKGETGGGVPVAQAAAKAISLISQRQGLERQ